MVLVESELLLLLWRLLLWRRNGNIGREECLVNNKEGRIPEDTHYGIDESVQHEFTGVPYGVQDSGGSSPTAAAMARCSRMVGGTDEVCMDGVPLSGVDVRTVGWPTTTATRVAYNRTAGAEYPTPRRQRRVSGNASSGAAPCEVSDILRGLRHLKRSVAHALMSGTTAIAAE